MTDGSYKDTKTMEALQSLLKEGKQDFFEIDAEGRVSFIIEAPLKAVDGTPCLKTSYKYLNPTSGQVIASKEELVAFVEATWKFENV